MTKDAPRWIPHQYDGNWLFKNWKDEDVLIPSSLLAQTTYGVSGTLFVVETILAPINLCLLVISDWKVRL